MAWFAGLADFDLAGAQQVNEERHSLAIDLGVDLLAPHDGAEAGEEVLAPILVGSDRSGCARVLHDCACVVLGFQADEDLELELLVADESSMQGADTPEIEESDQDAQLVDLRDEVPEAGEQAALLVNVRDQHLGRACPIRPVHYTASFCE